MKAIGPLRLKICDFVICLVKGGNSKTKITTFQQRPFNFFSVFDRYRGSYMSGHLI